MAEYYPLLSKAVGSLPSSTPETRRIVYERARKALIGQLRTMHPPIPDEDIERESVALDRAVERLESELASGAPDAAAAPAKPKPTELESGAPKPAPKPAEAKAASANDKPKPAEAQSGAIGTVEPKPTPPVRAKPPSPFAKKADAPKPPVPSSPPVPAGTLVPETPPPPPEASVPAPAPSGTTSAEPPQTPKPPPPALKPPRSDARPIAPQPPGAERPKRRLWIIPAGVGLVVVLVALAAWKLRDRPEQIAKTKPAETTQADTGKIAERVGGKPAEDKAAPAAPDASKPEAQTPPAATPDEAPQKQTQQATPPAANNPEVPVAHRAALLVEAPDEPNKVKTFLGTVVWKLNNVPQGPNDSVGLAVEADIDLPDDKLKAVVTFEKNTDTSLAASHTIKVRFTVAPGSFSGDVKQISTPQMRPEASPSGDPLAGVTVPIVANSFLVGLSPGNAEAANIDLMRRLQWIDIPMLLDSGKIAKLTFEKSDSGQRDLNEAFNSWTK